MSLLIIKIVLIILLIRVIFYELLHLGCIFWNYGTQSMVDEILKDPHKYVRDDHMCKFMYNMIWIAVFIQLLIAAYNGHITIN